MAGRFVYNAIHYVWSTRERREWIAESWEEELYAYIGGIARNKKGTLLQAGGMSDHIHLLVSQPPTLSISEMVNALKANSSRWIHEDLPRFAAGWLGTGRHRHGNGARVTDPPPVERHTTPDWGRRDHAASDYHVDRASSPATRRCPLHSWTEDASQKARLQDGIHRPS